MRFSVLPFLAFILLSGTASFAAEVVAQSGQQAVLADESEDGSLDLLFSSLKKTRDADEAATIAARIDEDLDYSDSATIRLLIAWSDDARNQQHPAAALDFLSEAIALDPEDPAGRRKRAQLHYADHNYHKSMDDLQAVLALEPRDIGSMALMATILEQSGRTEQALSVWRHYLDIYPADRKVAAHVDAEDEKLAGKRI
ncbi:hypothetical protein FJU08_04660 [Martelella alba]|uniref:Uncharacterized protein n=1 Tax=Martelella alba TaxID=2590451 RepID=A0A506UGA9_9HYPH|nr:hypothetical protein [Martelella alba]TPW32305.1 hypothetical protein FJU08_04660 [Martelella alba]